MTKTIFPSINGLRAISIIIVIIYHLTLLQKTQNTDVEYNFFIDAVIKFFTDGYLAVNMFFLISGFLITALLLWEEEEKKDISLKNFYIRRLLRITPAYYFLLFIYGVLQCLHFIEISSESWLTALTYTKYFNWQKDWLTAHAWSLSVEENFYLLWPLVFLCGAGFRKWFCFIIIIGVPLMRIFIYHYPVSWINEHSLFTRGDAIATGCLLAMYKEELVNLLSRHWKKYFYLSISLLFFLRFVPDFFTYIGAEEINMIFIPLGLTSGTIANALIGTILLFSLFGPEGLWFKFLNLKVLNFIGLLSYSLYLWQQIAISESRIWLTQFPQNIIFLLIVATCSYYFIEKPFLKLKSRFTS